MKHTVKLLGISVYESEVKYDPSELYFQNNGGQFELFEENSDSDGDYEEESSFGFGSPR